MDLLAQKPKGKTNFVFAGEAGSGKSKIAINFAKYLSNLGESVFDKYRNNIFRQSF